MFKKEVRKKQTNFLRGIVLQDKMQIPNICNIFMHIYRDGLENMQIHVDTCMSPGYWETELQIVTHHREFISIIVQRYTTRHRHTHRQPYVGLFA